MTLEILPLSEICEVTAGGTPSRANEAFWGGDIPWVKISDMLQGQITWTEEAITPLGLQQSSAKLFPVGTLLLSIFATIGRTAILKIPAATNQAIAGLQVRDSDRVDSSYLRRYLEKLAPKLAVQARGVAQANINLSILRATEIPLPPLPEQRRIAAILDKADALRAKRREAIAKLDQLLQSVFLDMFGDRALWPRVCVGEICDVKGGKRLPKGQDYATTQTPYRYVRVSDIDMGHVREGELRYLSPEVQQKIKRYTVSKGDVIITIAGTIGVVAPVTTSLDGANLTENAAKLVPKISGSYVPEYLSFALSTDEAQEQIRSHTGQVTIGKLALFRIEKVEVPMPPVDLQLKFSAVAKEITQQKKQFGFSVSNLDRLFLSLQRDAFSGTL